MNKVKVGIINVTGYAGVELARLLSQHPAVELASVTGRSLAGQLLGEAFPQLSGINLTIEAKLGQVELAFSAMPHQESAKEVITLLDRGVRVIDISADFRLKDASAYLSWYGVSHPRPELLSHAVYGLPELHRTDIGSATLVANPGCYPTGAILALAPAVKSGIIAPEVIIDSKSGVSGAGRSLSLKTHFPEANENVTAYALDGHRHLPEIVQELSQLAPGSPPQVSFVPHLIPMTRGILTTAYAPLAPGKISVDREGQQALLKLYRDFYRDEPFVRVIEEPPHTKHAWGSNYCFICPTIDIRTGRLITVSAIDNLVKGAAGQAIQNMNLMLGIEETSGLGAPAVYP
ncbi:MAG: N-acetyl-gamma-glutamyl-phosphate reductase [Dehalococcoidales bacterium]|nr:N-acetyl-gamma-glutamyl-phosphate reductase [Dehalococcoidales bacterium]